MVVLGEKSICSSSYCSIYSITLLYVWCITKNVFLKSVGSFVEVPNGTRQHKHDKAATTNEIARANCVFLFLFCCCCFLFLSCPGRCNALFCEAIFLIPPSAWFWLNLFNAELSPKRYWRGPRSQEMGGEKETVSSVTLSPPE